MLLALWDGGVVILGERKGSCLAGQAVRRVASFVLVPLASTRSWTAGIGSLLLRTALRLCAGWLLLDLCQAVRGACLHDMRLELAACGSLHI